MTVALAILAAFFAWKWLKWKIIAESAIYWIVKRRPDFTTAELAESWEELIRITF